MSSIGDQIVAARKAKGMTQDALSKALNLSRSTISNWEIGRRLPDAQMLIRLSELLDYSFESGSAKPQALMAAPEQTFETPLCPEQSDGCTKKPSKRLIIAVSAVALCVTLLLFFVLKNKAQTVPKPDEKVEAARVTKAYYQQPNPNEAGKAFFNIDCVLQTNKTEGIDLWMYTLTMHEKHGVAYTIDEVETCTFVGNTVDMKEFSAEYLLAAGQNVDIEANGEWSIIGGLPVDEKVSGMGFVIRGTDENGSALSFVFYQPLASQ